MLTSFSRCTVATLFAVVVLSSALHAQSAGTDLPAGTIDGAITPDLIPDVVAFRLFLSVVAESRPLTLAGSASSSASQAPIIPSAKQRAVLGPAHLSEADLGAVVNALVEFRENLDQTLTAKPPTGASVTPEIADAKVNAVAQTTVDLLKAKMSSEGFQRLRSQVIAEKKNMKIIPIPQMPIK